MQTPRFPLVLRIIAALGKPFGYVWVPDEHVQVVYRMSRYAEARTPGQWGMIHYNRLIETLGPLIDTSGQLKESVFKDLLARDIVSVTLRVKVFVSYDPRRAPDAARSLTKCLPGVYSSVAESYLQWSLMSMVSRYESTQLTEAGVKARIEAETTAVVNEEMKPTGIQLNGSVRIMGVELPASMTERHEELAQRRASIMAARQYDSAELRRTWVMDALDKVAANSSGEFYVNFNDLLESYPLNRGALPSIKVIDQPPSSPPPPPPPPRQLGSPETFSAPDTSQPAMPPLEESRL